MRRLLCLMLASLLFSFVHAQSGKFFNTDDNLSSSFATQVMQDHNGFIWIATRNGLNVYNGYDFTTFTKDSKDNRGFSNNYVNALGEDNRGNIIVGTNNGIMVYDGGRFRNLDLTSDGKTVKCYINHILTRRDGRVWAATSGYGIMQTTADYTKCERLTLTPLDKYQYIHTAKEDSRGRVWIITEDFKLLRLEQNGRLTTRFPDIAAFSAKDIAEDRHGNIYLATLHHGVYVMNRGRGNFARIPGINLPDIERLCPTRNDMLYVGSNGHGIVGYNIRTGQTTDEPFFSYQTNLAKAKVYSIIEDRQGNIWIALLQKGIFMHPNKTYDFGYMGVKRGKYNLIGENCVTSIIQSRDGRTWLGTDKDYLYSLSPVTSPATRCHYTNTPSTILAVCEDAYGNIWTGSYREGAGYVEPNTGNYHPVNLGTPTPPSIFDIKCDPEGNLWFATMGDGVICLTRDRQLKHYTEKANASNTPGVNSLPNNYVAKLAFSKDYSKLYVATSVGLCCLDLKKNSWTSTFGRNVINHGSFSHCIQTDRKGRVWYGTEDGVWVYTNGNVNNPTRYTTANGLSNNGVASISEDAAGMMWVATTHGLNRINPETDDIKAFYSESGLQSNEFSDGAAFSANGGKLILLGGTGGINWFCPLAMKQHKSRLDVIISDFIVDNTPVASHMKSDGYTVTDKPVHASDRFDLSHEDGSFSIRLTTLTYNNVEQISYLYNINNEGWHALPAGQNDISFSHLPAGTYCFQVKAVTNGEESSVRQFTVRVHPAWYASTWARITYLAAVIAMAALYLRHRKRKEKERLILQQHIHAEEMSEAKLRFFMNISHEIRTPLTLIVSPLLSLIKDDKDPQRQGIYDLMQKNAERILHLINQMMDLRKIDKGMMVMHMAETDMVTFVGDAYNLFMQQARSRNISFHFNHDTDSLNVWIDRNNFDKVLMNVLSNAFKFTPSGGTIHITLTHSEHHAYISVKDSGCGIPKEQLETIFQRFYQSTVTEKNHKTGTGIGLDLARSLVEMHCGTIVARNNEGATGTPFCTGSEFVIRLPLGNAHLAPENIIAATDSTTIHETTAAEAPEAEEMLADTVDTLADTDANTDTAVPHIAVVEDDEDILEYLRRQFGATFKVSTFRNGKEALPAIIQQMPDIVISDVMMPEMEGTVLCAKLKSNINTNHIPVILLTAMTREEDQLTGLQTGADAYITKPFNWDILLRTTLNLLAVRRTLRNKFNGNENPDDKIDDISVASPDDTLMQKIMTAINENISNPDLSVDMIADLVGISRVHLHRKMKELTNQTPHSFIRNLRLKQAARILRESHKNVTEVMYKCGFCNAASFSTMFKNMYGCSPRDYMNQHNAKG